ncbi:HEAT repeat domain-containing protein [Candidatus Poribacteria bacterium]|nr:HEAT repeat domain-containing protein [Candidatus Poribacteria bacterium]
MKQYSIFLLTLILCGAFIIGCADKEDKALLSARQSIVDGDYPAAITAVDKSRQNNPDNQEAVFLSRLLQLRTSTDTNDWHQVIAQILDHLKTVNSDIRTITILDDPDSDELNRQERLIRSRNSISGLLVSALAIAVEKQPTLLSDLANRSDTVIVTALLEAQKCYQPNVHATIDNLLQQVNTTTENTVANLTAILTNTNQTDPQIKESALRELYALQSFDQIPIYKSILSKTDEAPEVSYSAIVALEGLCQPNSKLNDQVIPLLQLATRNNNAQVRMHAAKLIGRLQTASAVDDLIKLLSDSNTYVRTTAIVALDRIGQPSVQPLLDVLKTGATNIIPNEDAGISDEYKYIASAYIDDSWMKKYRLRAQTAAIETLATIRAEEAILPLIQLLDNEDLKVAAHTGLITMRGAAVPALIHAIQTGEPAIQLESAKALSAIGDRRAIAPFIDILMVDVNKEIKAIAAEGLGNMRARGTDNSAVLALSKALELDDTTVTQAAEALGKININIEDTTRKLIAISMDKLRRETVRIAALNALWQLKPASATQPMLLLMLNDESSPVIRANAVKVLSRIQDTETLTALFWVLSMQFDEISDFQRHMKRKFKTLDALRSHLDSLNIMWTADYPRPYYRIWGELKPIPSLVRSEVAKALGIFKGEIVVDPLISALNDDQRATVRRNAAWALGRVSGEKAIDALITALKKDKQGVVRQEAAIALGTIKSPKSVDTLLDIIKTDKYETARLEATKALREINPTLADKGLVDIIKKGRGSFEDGFEVQSVQNEVIGALLLNGNAVTTEHLLNALNSADDEWTHWAIVYMLGVIHHKSSLDAILSRLDHDSYVIRREAVTRLGGYKDRATVEPLIAIVKNKTESKTIRAAAIGSLNALRDERAAPVLREALNDQNGAIRWYAVVGLGAIKDAKAVEKLRQMAENTLENDAIRAAAVSALGNIGDTASEDLLIRALNNRIGNISNNAIAALGKMEIKSAVPHLIRIMEDVGIPLNASTALLANASPRSKATVALGQIGGPEAIAALSNRLINDTEFIIALEDEANRRNLALDDRKRNWSWEPIVGAAKKHKLPQFISEKMQTRADDTWESPPIRNAASVALGRTQSLDLSKLRENLSDPVVDTRKDTARTIGESETVALIDELILVANGEKEDNKDVRRLATQALGVLAQTSTTDALIQIMNKDENHIEIRRDAARSLGKIASDGAVSALVEKFTTLYADKTERAFQLDIIRALGDAKDDSATQILEKVLEDTDADIHFLAASVLFDITGNGYGYDRL